MSELRDLYQQVILDHNKSPRNHRVLESATHKADGHNPLCGDKVTVFVEVNEGRITAATFVGSGCAISTASASLMTESLKGKTVPEAQQLFTSVHELLTAPDEPDDVSELGKLAVFSGVREFPMRVKCASLAWHTLKRALDGKVNDGPARTE
jgi:nitrogen fixation NifU-like protein